MSNKNPNRVYIKEVTVIDPDSGGEVEIEIWKDMETGGMFGVDESFLEAENGCIYNPFSGEKQVLDVNDIP